MSSTWIAEFDNEKDYNHLVARFNEIAPNGGNVIAPDIPNDPKHENGRGAWVNLDDTVYLYDNEDCEAEPVVKEGAWAISFDIAIWDDWTKNFIRCIFQEMCHRYSFVEIGCNSVKLISAEEFLTWDIFGQPKRTIEYCRRISDPGPHYIFGWGEEVRTVDFNKLEEKIEKAEKAFGEAAKRFFDGDASDLILEHEKEED